MSGGIGAIDGQTPSQNTGCFPTDQARIRHTIEAHSIRLRDKTGIIIGRDGQHGLVDRAAGVVNVTDRIVDRHILTTGILDLDARCAHRFARSGILVQERLHTCTQDPLTRCRTCQNPNGSGTCCFELAIVGLGHGGRRHHQRRWRDHPIGIVKCHAVIGRICTRQGQAGAISACSLAGSPTADHHIVTGDQSTAGHSLVLR